MNNAGDSLQTGMTMFFVVLLTALFESQRPAIESNFEKILGHKPTNEEWGYILQEYCEKAQAEFQREQFRQWKQSLVDRKKIHDFVWGIEYH